MIRIIIEVDDKRQVFINGKKINQPGQKPLKSKIESGSDSRRQSMDSERICPTCQEPFKPNGPRQKYCSEKCGMKPKPESEKIRAKQRRENKSGSVRITPNLRPKPKQLPKKAIGQKAICSKCGKECSIVIKKLYNDCKGDKKKIKKYCDDYLCRTCNPDWGSWLKGKGKRGRKCKPENEGFPKKAKCISCGKEVGIIPDHIRGKAKKLKITVDELIKSYHCRSCGGVVPHKKKRKKSKR